MRPYAPLLALLVVSACSDPARPPITGSTGTDPGTSQTTPKDGGTPDADDLDSGVASCSKPGLPGELYALSARNLSGTATIPLCDYRGKVLLIVDGASSSPYTAQYSQLQDLYSQYASLGFVVLDFPCNQFGAAEPRTPQEIAEFAATTYKVTFPILEKSDVNGPSAHPVFTWLKAQKGGEGDLSANFEKFLVGRNGLLRRRFPATVQPDSPEMLSELQLALSEP